MLRTIFGILVAAGATSFVYIKAWAFQYWGRKGLSSLEPVFPLGHAHDILFQKNSIGQEFELLHNEIKSKYTRHGGLYMFTNPIYMPVDLGIVNEILKNSRESFSELALFKSFSSASEASLMRLLRLESFFNKMLTSAENSSCVLIEPGNESFTEALRELESHLLAVQFFGKDLSTGNNLNDLKSHIIGTVMHRSSSVGLSLLANIILNCFERQYEKRITADIFTGHISKLLSSGDSSTLTSEIISALDIGTNRDDVEGVSNSRATVVFDYIKNFNIVFASVLPFCFYELCYDTNVQEKLRIEIAQILEANDNKLSYEGVAEMKYLDQVIKETLRKYPPYPFVVRQCTKEFVIPSSVVELEAGTNVVMSTLGIHRDNQFYTEPDVYNPDRFSELNVQNIRGGTFLPFGKEAFTPGEEFALLQAKLILIVLLKRFRFSFESKQVGPVESNPRHAYLTPKEPLHLRIEPIN